MSFNFFWHCFPYCLKRIGESHGILLNRNYKPIGYNKEFRDYVVYESQQSLFKLPLPWGKLVKYFGYEFQSSAPENIIYFYHDSKKPFYCQVSKKFVATHWAAYAKMLIKLARLDFKPPDYGVLVQSAAPMLTYADLQAKAKEAEEKYLNSQLPKN